MRLKSPQPRQSFFGIPPHGRTFHSDDYGFIEVTNEEDARSLRAMGCVDAPASAKPKEEAKTAHLEPRSQHEDVSGAMHGLSPHGQEDSKTAHEDVSGAMHGQEDSEK